MARETTTEGWNQVTDRRAGRQTKRRGGGNRGREGNRDREWDISGRLSERGGAEGEGEEEREERER